MVLSVQARKSKQAMVSFSWNRAHPFMRSEGLYLEAIIASLLATGAVKSCGDSSLLCDRS
jgi:hypothetical protein